MNEIKNTNLIPPSPEIDIQNLKPFTRFCCSIGAIPTSYLVSMSYEEQLLWLCDFLENTVIPTVNNNGEAVAELQALFIQLKDYVDNYFKNLDVQDEINNKLDQMAEDGTLVNIINAYLQMQTLICFDSIADMKNSNNLKNGSFAKTLGFYSANDLGGGIYKIKDKNNISPNEMNIISLNNNLIAELIIDNNCIPQQFGAKADGINDDTLSLQTYINNSLNKKLFPSATYLTNSLSFPDNSFIIFENCELKRISHNGGRFIDISNNSNIYGYLKVNGNISTMLNEVLETGITFADNVNVYGTIESFNNSQHGIQIGNNNIINNLIAHHNGIKKIGAGLGTGDGIYSVNKNNSSINYATSFNNARNGISITTYNSETQGTNLELSKNIVINNASCYDNDYTDIDYEAISNAYLFNTICKGSIAASQSKNCNFENIKCSLFYAENHDNCNLKNCECNPINKTSNIVYITGKNINVNNVVINDTASSYSENAFQINDTANNAIVNNITVYNSFNSISITGCKSASNLVSVNYSNLGTNIDGRRLYKYPFIIENGLLTIFYNKRPGAGWGLDSGNFKKGDKTVITSDLLEDGNDGSKYVLTGFINTVDGPINQFNWLPMRILTGN